MTHHSSPHREAWFGCEHDRYSREGDECRFGGGYGISGGGLAPGQREEPGWLSGRHPFDPDVSRWRYDHLRILGEEDGAARPQRFKRMPGELGQWRQMRYVAQTAVQPGSR